MQCFQKLIWQCPKHLMVLVQILQLQNAHFGSFMFCRYLYFTCYFPNVAHCVSQAGRSEAHRGEMYADQRHFERTAAAFGNSRLLGPPDSTRWTLLLHRLEWWVADSTVSAMFDFCRTIFFQLSRAENDSPTKHCLIFTIGFLSFSCSSVSAFEIDKRHLQCTVVY